MAGNSYPHIIFAKDAQVLPQQSLAEVLTGMFPHAEVEQGEIKAVLRLPDYAYTFWYDDDADGLGDRYADYAAPLRRKRVTRCTTMIDASGDADPEGAHAEEVARIMGALAQRDGVYVFSEETKRFLGMDYDDAPATTTASTATTATGPAVGAVTGEGAAVEDTMVAEVAASTGQREEEFVSPLEGATTPAADLQSTYSNPAHAAPEQSEVVLASEDTHDHFRHTEHHPVDGPVPPGPAGTPVPDTAVSQEHHEDHVGRPVADTGTTGVAPVRESVGTGTAETTQTTGTTGSAGTTEGLGTAGTDRGVDRTVVAGPGSGDAAPATGTTPATPSTPSAPATGTTPVAPAASAGPVTPVSPATAAPAETGRTEATGPETTAPTGTTGTTASEQDEQGRTGFFKRLFKRNKG